MSPLSDDPRRRERQLGNLRRGQTVVPGNQAARTHGAYARVADDLIDDKVREVATALAEDAPVKDADGGLPAHDAPLVRLFAEVLCRVDSVAAYLRDHGILDNRGRLRVRELDIERQLRREAADYAAEMGMTPRSRAALGLDLARTKRTTLQDFIDGDASEVDR